MTSFSCARFSNSRKFFIAWRSSAKYKGGKALAWWVKQVEAKGWLERAMG
jgi:hypothetical protein